MKFNLAAITIFLGLSMIHYANGQVVEHNYIVGPQVVTCDSLELTPNSIDENIASIRSAKFRFDQSFRLTRKTGLQTGEYYSCDNLTGFLIIKYNGTFYLYREVNKNYWDQMLSSSDPEGFYLKNKDKFVE